MQPYKVIDQFWIDEDLHIRAILTTASNKWYLQYNEPGSGKGRQRRKSLKTTNKKEAKLRGYAFARDFAGGDIPARNAANATVGRVIDLRMQRLQEKGRAASTLRLSRRYFDLLTAFLPSGGKTPLTGLKLLVLESFERKLRESGVDTPAYPERGTEACKGVPLSPKTVREVMKAVRSLMRFARERELLDRDPASGYELPEGESEEIEVFSPAELHAIFEDPMPGAADLWRFMTYCALRIQEFTWLMKNDIIIGQDGKPAAIHIRKKVCPVSHVAWHPKHHMGRTVPLTAEAGEILIRSMAASSGPWAFASPQGARVKTGRWPHTRLRAWFHRRLREAGIKHGHPHVMRHTFASYLANSVKMSIPLLQRFLGHQDLASTMRYLHANATDVGEALGRGDYSKLAFVLPDLTIAAASAAFGEQSTGSNSPDSSALTTGDAAKESEKSRSRRKAG